MPYESYLVEVNGVGQVVKSTGLREAINVTLLGYELDGEDGIAVRCTKEATMLREEWKNGEYRTSDTPKAAWLISQGYSLIDIDYSEEGRAVMVFPNDSNALTELVSLYDRTEAQGSITAFYDAYRELVNRIKNKLPVFAGKGT